MSCARRARELNRIVPDHRQCAVCAVALSGRQRITCSRAHTSELNRRRGAAGIYLGRPRLPRPRCAMPDCARVTPSRKAKYCGLECRRRSLLPDWGVRPLSVTVAARA